MGDIADIKRRLVSDPLPVCEHLLPGGRREGNQYLAGSTGGEAGKSLKVELVGSKAGVWSDFANPEDSGDLIDLWCKARGRELTAALDEIRDWYGIERPTVHRPAQRSYTRPPKPQCHAPKAAAKDYLVEARNIPQEILDRFQIGEDGRDIVFPFLFPNGELALAKKRTAEDGGRTVPTAKDCEPILFGWQAVPPDAREIVITEGEIDALSMAAYGFAAMSVPFGGGGGNKQQWIESDYERMERFEKIYLATDMDEPGEQAAQEIAARLGRHRCFRVTLPRKDANQCLVDGITPEDIQRAVYDAETYDPAGLEVPSAYADNVISLFYPSPGSHTGYTTPYEKLKDKLHFRPGELTVWSGDTGAGKTQCLLDCAVDWIEQGSRVCLSSLEMKPQYTLKRMVKQSMGVDRPTENAIRASLDWLDKGLIVYDLVGKSKIDELLEVFAYARAKYGCDQFVIDSLMRLGIKGDDYNEQERVVYELVEWAIANDVHVHLVAHSKKGAPDRGVPNGADVKGAGEIINNAFNIIIVWRNRKHEEKLQSSAITDEERAELRAKAGVVFNVDKQRNGDWTGKVGLWFDTASYQYRSAQDSDRWRRKYVEVSPTGREEEPEIDFAGVA